MQLYYRQPRYNVRLDSIAKFKSKKASIFKIYRTNFELNAFFDSTGR